MIENNPSSPPSWRTYHVELRSHPRPHLHANLGLEPLARALRRFNCQTDCGGRALAHHLFDMQGRDLHQLIGFVSAAHFAVERLDMKRRTDRDVINVGRARVHSRKPGRGIALLCEGKRS
ncbi:MAG TPA: hypothetical protein ENK43_03950, partial [Planctomycetes bacterium]|nr:hypothetical protein [Planctomycetota bacterium]